MEIKWSRLAIKQLFDIIQYLEENDSVDYAEKLEKKVLSKIKSLPQKIEIYQLDRLKQANDGNFYAFEITGFLIGNYKRRLGY
ncbi:type II toxin-antitoxin system RelE/ParE family toxin [Pedobacter frigiditerrae]|uniref:type II toxin-antitoxin system RelE/ParE family toxin n=1 Tax=Pedobacter frigiditerrae TaxID=2530452 RepID=UPI00292FB4FA|nr:type II toxin-antitoxin system RelE/ParE family toxin [Pedobacter frigiditerrae]